MRFKCPLPGAAGVVSKWPHFDGVSTGGFAFVWIKKYKCRSQRKYGYGEPTRAMIRVMSWVVFGVDCVARWPVDIQIVEFVHKAIFARREKRYFEVQKN